MKQPAVVLFGISQRAAGYVGLLVSTPIVAASLEISPSIYRRRACLYPRASPDRVLCDGLDQPKEREWTEEVPVGQASRLHSEAVGKAGRVDPRGRVALAPAVSFYGDCGGRGCVPLSAK